MPKSKNTCCVKVCNSGRKDCNDDVSWHDVKEGWIPYFPNIEWKYSSSSKLCSKHFHSDDFKTKSTDSNSTRQKEGTTLQRKTLIPTAVPSIWPDIPHTKLKNIPAPRKTARSSAEMRRLAEEDMLVKEDSFSGLDSITTECIDIPDSFHLIRQQNLVLFIKLETKAMPQVICSLKIFENLQFQLYDDHEQIYLKDLVPGIDGDPCVINRYSLISRILHSLDYRPSTNTLEKRTQGIAKDLTDLFPENKKSEFLAEQIKLLESKPKRKALLVEPAYNGMYVDAYIPHIFFLLFFVSSDTRGRGNNCTQ